MKRFTIAGLAAAAVSCSILATVLLVNRIGIAANNRQQIIETQNNNDRSSSQLMTIGNNIDHNRRRLQQVKHLDCTNGQCNEQVIPSDVTAQLEDAPERLTEEQRKQRIKAFLGGLYPHLDDNMLPKYLRDSMPREKLSDKDVAYFWHIPKVRKFASRVYVNDTINQALYNSQPTTFFLLLSLQASGSTLKNIMNFCFDLKRAENTDGLPSLEYKRNNILNMDTTSPDGLDKSYEVRDQIFDMGVDLIVSNYFLAGAALFNDRHRGRTFTVLRHPIEIAQSLFHYRKKAKWERTYRKDWNKITFVDYAKSESYIANWVVRQLTGTMPWVTLTEEHLEKAKLVLKEKVLVGIADQMDETVRQLREYFGWKEKEPFCAYNYLHGNPSNTNPHPLIKRGSETWNMLAEKEKWDMALYHFALELFAEQREMIKMVKIYRDGAQ